MRFGRNLREDLGIMKKRYNDAEFEKALRTTSLKYYLEEVMVAGTGELDALNNTATESEYYGMILSARSAFILPFSKSNLMLHAKEYAAVKSLTESEPENPLSAFDNLIKSANPDLQKDFRTIVDIFQVVFEIANRGYKQTFRPY